MRILVTGAAGLLGNAVVRTAKERSHDVRALSRSDLDVVDPGEVERRLNAERPEVVVHCAAYTAVDRAEEESDQAMSGNRDGTRNGGRAGGQNRREAGGVGRPARGAKGGRAWMPVGCFCGASSMKPIGRYCHS